MVPAIDFARAGGGPENVFLLVNSRSQASLAIANHYIALRKIPAANVYYLKWDPAQYSTSGATFSDRILKPALSEMLQRGLKGQIDYLVYSSDFPVRLNFKADYPGEKFPAQLRPTASLTGATYLTPFVLGKRKEMFNLNTNFYAAKSQLGITTSRGFRSNYSWSPTGKRVKNGQQGLSYLLSTMLGVTYGRGNTEKEVIRYLRSSAEADGLSPRGTIYLMKNDNIRSTVRHRSFPDVKRELALLGVQAKILKGTLPAKKFDVMGITMGAARFNLIGSGVEMRPGAIGDNLTSYGGIFVKRKPWKPPKDNPKKKPPGPPQTVLTDFLRAGAAGASGTVIEPFALQAKFPLPSIHVHYARGCSLAEAFYQSVTGPFQLLVVGDPLCRPWADISKVTVDGIDEGQTVRGNIKVTPTASISGKTKVKRFELFVDGIRTQMCNPGEAFQLNTTALADGFHEVRVVAIDDTPIETQGRWIGWVTVKNGRNALQMTVSPASRVSVTKELKISVTSTMAGTAAIMNNGLELGLIKKGQGSIRVKASKLGKGPSTLQARIKADSEQTGTGLTSRPVSIEVY